jgi:hypothetical protein
MNKVGIICDINYSRHHLFKSYYRAIQNLYGEVQIVNHVDDLKGINLLFICDDHYSVHKAIWQNIMFIGYCNINKIKVVTLTNEKILNSYFPWNEEGLKMLNKFKYLYHYGMDVEDCQQLKLRLNRIPPSIYFEDSFPVNKDKKDKMVFIGSLSCPKNSYNERKELIRELKKDIDINVYENNIPTWNEYLKIISAYRFILSPIGNGNMITTRFYEVLDVESIPVHQVRENTLKYYDIEANYDDCIFFKDIPELRMRVDACKFNRSYNKIWMEECLQINLTMDFLYELN